MSQLGFNGAVLDVEPPRAKKRKLMESEEEQIKAIIDNKTINKTGGLFRCGVHIANSDVVLEANRRIAKAEEEKKKTLQHKKRRMQGSLIGKV